MTTTQQDVEELYSSLSDERLAAIALRGGLTPDAERAMKRELQRRGISDLSSWRKEIEQDVVRLESKREAKVETFGRVRRWRNRFVYFISGLVAFYGVYLLLVPKAKPDGEDGGFLILFGAALAIGTWIASKIQKAWQERVLLKPWWR